MLIGLIIVNKLAIGLRQYQLIPQMLRSRLIAFKSNRRNAFVHELLHSGLKLVEGFRNSDAIFIEHVLVVVRQNELTVDWHAIPFAVRGHNATIIGLIFGHSLNGFRQRIGPTIFVRIFA